jgi:phage FluMu protein Com
MAIEFHCTGCGRLLRTGDDTAGKRAKCPQCGTVVTIPAAAPSSPPSPPPTADSVNPYQSPQAPTMSAERPGSPFQPAKFEVGDILGRTWAIFTSQFGLCFGVPATAVVIEFAAGQIWNYFFPQPTNAAAATPGRMMFWLLGLVPLMVLSIYLRMGVLQVLLKVVRGQPRTFGELFHGGPQFPPFLVIEVLFSLLVGVGCCFCLVPGIFVASFFFLASLLVLDRQVPVLDSFGASKNLVGPNPLIGVIVVGLPIGALIPTFVAAFLVPPLAPLLGLLIDLIVVPYATMLCVVAYWMLRGEAAASGSGAPTTTQ